MSNQLKEENKILRKALEKIATHHPRSRKKMYAIARQALEESKSYRPKGENPCPSCGVECEYDKKRFNE